VLLPVVLMFSSSQAGDLLQASARTWLAFGYVSAFSMFIAFFFWYRGLALGGVARVGQVQLLQAFLSIIGAAILLGEPITLTTCAFALAVVATVFAGRRMQIRR
jgi:drug/metabolite transporter (DMT)-like permease